MGERVVDMPTGAGAHTFVEDRPIGDAGLDAVAKSDLARLLGERLDKGVVERRPRR